MIIPTFILDTYLRGGQPIQTQLEEDIIVRYATMAILSFSKTRQAEILSEDDLADLVQDAILHAMDRIGQYSSSKGKMGTWVYCISLRYANDWASKRYTRASHYKNIGKDSPLDSYVKSVAAVGVSPEDELLSKELSSHYEAYKSKLKDDVRTLLDMQEDGLKPRHMAAVLNEDVQVLKARAFRSRKAAKAAMSAFL